MSKKFIRNAAAIGAVLVILGLIILLSFGSAGSWLAILLEVIGGVAALLAYIGALIKVARMRRLGWFVGILLTGVLGALIYGLVGPEIQVSNEAMSSFLYRSYQQTKKTLGQ